MLRHSHRAALQRVQSVDETLPCYCVNGLTQTVRCIVVFGASSTTHSGNTSNTTLSVAAKYFLPTPSRLYSKCASERAFLKYKREAPPKRNNLRQLPASKTETAQKPQICTPSGGKTRQGKQSLAQFIGSKPNFSVLQNAYGRSLRGTALPSVKQDPTRLRGERISAAKNQGGKCTYAEKKRRKA